MRVAFLMPHVPGHAYPMSSLARRLKSRGHDVVSIGIPDAAPFVRAAEIPFVRYCEKEYPAGSLREKRARANRLQGQEALGSLIARSLRYCRQSSACRDCRARFDVTS
jgi:zeaxanthin glucosyltransferase